VQEVDVPMIRYPGVVGEHPVVAFGPLPCVGVQAVADQRQAAAHLLGDDGLEPIACQDLDRGLGHVRLVVVGRAAVEVHNGLFGTGLPAAARRARALAPLPGGLERPAGEPGDGCLAVDADGGFHDGTDHPVAHDNVGDRGEPHAQ
jgi:hypothetical protein